MKRIGLTCTATALVAFSGVLVSTANGSPSTVDKAPTLRMAMHDDMMKMDGPGMQGPGMQGPPKGTPGSTMQGHPAGTPGGTTQSAPAGAPGAKMQGPGMQGHSGMGSMVDLPVDRIEGRIAFLHAELRITDAQMPTWNEFANVLRANAKRVDDAQKADSQRPNSSAVDRLDNQERWLTVRLESVRALKAAYAKLYTVLDDSQKKTADQLVTHQMGIR